MFGRNGLKLVTAGALAIATISFPAFAGAARDRVTATTEFSAQADNPNQKKNAAPKQTAPARVAPRQAAPVHVAPRQVQPRVIQRQVQPRVIQKQDQPRVIQKQVQPRVIQKQVQPRVIPRTDRTTTARKVFTPRGANSRVVSAARIRHAPARGAFRTTIRGRDYSVWRSGYRARHGNRWRTFVALGALSVLAIGAYEYYPYAYIDAPADYCDGLTEDGCQLVYDEVQTVEGDVVPQCVAYCPQQ